jgi:hypothetical protein
MRPSVNKLKTALLSGLGIVGGVVTLKALRKRRTETVDDAESTDEADADGAEENVRIDEAEATTDEEAVTDADATADEEATIDDVLDEAEETAGHVSAAVEHGRATVEKVAASVRQKA